MSVSIPVVSMCIVVASCGGGYEPGTKSRAVAFSAAVNVRATDVPEMAMAVAGFQTSIGPPFVGCVTGVGRGERIVAVNSPRFIESRGGRPSRRSLARVLPLPVSGLHSAVFVMREAQSAARNVADLRDRDVVACVDKLSVGEASGQFIKGEPRKSSITASALPFPVLGVSGYGIRVQGTVAAAVYHRRQRPRFYEDTFGFAVGPAEIVLHMEGIETPVSSILERRLLVLLYRRSVGHRL